MPLNVDKQLPSLPGDLSIDPASSPTLLAPPATGGRVNMARPRPTLNFEKPLSSEELAHLRDHWNEAASARRIRFQRHPVDHDRLRSAPLPTSEAENVSGSISRENDPSTPTPRKRWGIFTRLTVDAQKIDEQAPKNPKHVRFQNVLNTGNVSPAVHPMPREAAASTPTVRKPTGTPVTRLDQTAQELGIDLNDGGIYLTLDPEWRSSSGEVVLTFLSPIPDVTTKASSTSKRIRSKKFSNIAKAARSTPNLNAAAKADKQRVSPSVHHIPREATASASAIKQPANTPVNQLYEAVQELEIDLNDG
ncbi:uncharacterized protein EDB91DRAFT_1251242 [Suillus paluster]|uniref:uncharacterized protein n=1 Tax=Suillus paluster TaxID=48578 RepID=UPI001B860E6E|nr:uncharacterized protein EDB91DRAFT_1251242 [Suillus paluster]KAG1733577.1 hypothetical protein EDB91DRAFT_1251242 [Suillus paluster]